jgi:hypothetical protein
MLRSRRTLPLRGNLEGSHAQSEFVRNSLVEEEFQKRCCLFDLFLFLYFVQVQTQYVIRDDAFAHHPPTESPASSAQNSHGFS